jgi:hypothetical protein
MGSWLLTGRINSLEKEGGKLSKKTLALNPARQDRFRNALF